MRSGRGAVGSVRVLSINTWIIIINVAVFFASNVVLQATQWPVQLERVFAPGATAEARARAQPDRSQIQKMPDGSLAYPLVVMRTDERGRSWRVQVGYEQFRPMPVLVAFGHFSTGKFWSDGQVWRLISFQFLHNDVWHLVFNMLGLWFVGGLVEQYLGARRYAVFYLMSGVGGGLMYMLLNLLGYIARNAGVTGVPFLLVEDPYTPLIGASAGVFGVLMAAAFIAPDARVEVLLLFPMRLQTAVYIFLALAIANLWQLGRNAGGDAAHVGGALVGALLIRRPHLLRDWLSALRLAGDGRPAASRRKPDGGIPEAEMVDRVLGKIAREGLESLDESERAVLRRASGRSLP